VAITLFYALLSVLVVYLVFKNAPLEIRLPYAFFIFPYLITTVIGTLVISTSNGLFLLQVFSGGPDVTAIHTVSGIKYWFLVYSPFFIPGLSYLVTRKYFSGVRIEQKTETELHPAGFILVLCLVAGYCFYSLASNGFLGNIGKTFELQGDYQSFILLREEAFSKLGRVFFGFLYMTLPTLSNIAMFQFFYKKRAIWAVIFLVSFLATTLFVLMTMQKGVLLVYYLALFAGYIVLRKVRVLLLFSSMGIGILLLTALQAYATQTWDLLASVYNLIFRMAGSVVFYLNLFPHVLPHSGIDMGLDLLGILPKPEDPRNVFQLMYPKIGGEVGEAPSPAHVSAYAQSGMWFSILTLILIGIALNVFPYLRRRAASPYAFALFVEGLVLFYYLTQVNLRGALITSYGYVWVIFAVILVGFANTILRGAVQKHEPDS